MKAAIIGLGNIGGRLAKNLVAGGHSISRLVSVKEAVALV